MDIGFDWCVGLCYCSWNADLPAQIHLRTVLSIRFSESRRYSRWGMSNWENVHLHSADGQA